MATPFDSLRSFASGPSLRVEDTASSVAMAPKVHFAFSSCSMTFPRALSSVWGCVV